MSGADLLEPLRQHAGSGPDRVALRSSAGADTTFYELVSLLDGAVARLAAAGVTPAARVATILPNAPSTAVAILAIAARAAVMPINPAFPLEEMQRTLAQARASHLVADTDHLPEATELARKLGIPLIRLLPRADRTGAFELAGACPTPGAVAGGPTADGSRVALILHTSGSTGTPKRVPLSASNLVYSARNVGRSLDLGEADVCLNMMPMFHVGALVDLLLAPLYAGGAVAFADAISADAFFAGLRGFAPTWFQAVPTVLRDILARRTTRIETERVRRLRFIRAVSQPLPAKLQQDFEDRFGVDLVPIFGMTETAGLIASMPLDKPRRRPGSVGQASGMLIRIADEFGNEVPPSRRGEVLVSGPNVTAGYEDLEGGRDATFRGEWLRTGDEGYLDADDYLFLTGRLKDVINRGGEKISPAEIDFVLADHPAIREAAAFAKPHPTLGDEVAVAVVPASPGLQAPEVTRYVRERLAEFKAPHAVYFLDALPRLPSGKLDRRALAHLADAAAAPRRTPPTTPIEKSLAGIWRRFLAVDDLALEDDFFERGGDSLMATNMVAMIEDRFGRDLPFELLFDAPTLGEMAGVLAQGVAARSHGDLDPAIHDGVRKATVAWRGQRRDGSLIVGRNTVGTKRPFFWACQAQWEFELLAEHFDPDRPFHILSTLSNTRLKSVENTRLLVQHYAREIQAIQPEGPYLLGGFCQGGVVAFEIAKTLRAAGGDVALLVLHDRFIPEPYDGEVAFFWGKRGWWYCAYDLHEDPARAWAKYYSGPVCVFDTDGDHGDILRLPLVKNFARQLEAEFQRVEAGRPSHRARRFEPAQPLDAHSFVSTVRAKVPLLLRQGSVHSIPVSVTNASPVTWEPTAASGIILAARWRTFDRHFGAVIDGRAHLPEAIRPGETARLDLAIRVPMRGLPMLLHIDLVEDGLRWFSSAGRSGAHRLVLPLPPE